MTSATSRGGGRRHPRATAALAAWLALAVGGRAEAAWFVPEAGAQVRCARDAGTPAAGTGWLRLWPATADAAAPEVRVFTAAGAPVPSRPLWAAAGEPLTVLFDCSGGETQYVACLVASNAPPAPAPAWEPTGGLILETRRRPEGDADTWQKTRDLCRAASPPLGRGVVAQIFSGVHPHGPNRDFAAWYRGGLVIAQAGAYTFATVSKDASALLIDGAVVAAWPGWHDVQDGLRGEHSGAVRLEPGTHRIEYVNVLNGEGYTAVAAWKPPGRDRLEVIPPSAFAPVSTFTATAVERPPGAAPEPYPTWLIEGHCAVGDLALVDVAFEALGAPDGVTCRWQFGDGMTEEGPRVRHTFAGAGPRAVTLEYRSGPTVAARAVRRIDVHPRWDQVDEWPAERFQKQREAVMRRELRAAPAADLDALARLAGRIEDRPLLDRVGATVRERSREFGPDQAETFYVLGFHYQHPEVRQYPLAEQCLRQAGTLASTGTTLRARAVLHLAGFLIHTGRPEEGQAALAGIDAARLPPEDQRLQRIFAADALLAGGHADTARQRYAEIGTTSDLADRSFAAQRRARIEVARDDLARGEYDAAGTLIRTIEWETPLERVNTETGLIMIGVNMGRREYPFARAHALRLLATDPADSRRAELLFVLASIARATGHGAEEVRWRRELARDHRYSEAAARATDLWGAVP